MSYTESQEIWDRERARRAQTIPEIVASHAASRPNALAFTFLPDGLEVGTQLTFAELDRQARMIAGAIGDHRGHRALLVYPSGADFVTALLGCLYAGVVAVHAPLISMEAADTASRAELISTDCEAALVLAPKAVADERETSLVPDQDSPLAKLPWYATDELTSGEGPMSPDPTPRRGDLAMIQYTSGSTGVARGVPLEHGHLVDQACGLRARAQSREDTVSVGWAPLFHDLGLFANVLTPLYGGRQSVILPPWVFLRWPERWLAAITRHSASISGGPSFAYEHCVRKVSPDERRQLDLSRWTLAFVGAEPIQPVVLERFAGAFASTGFSPSAFCPGYGLAEASCVVSLRATGTGAGVRTFERRALGTGAAVEARSGRRLVSAGLALAEHELAIVDPVRLSRCPTDTIGEVWVRGPFVARGYWRRPADQEVTFSGYLAETREGPFLRTGDLGFLLDGELFVVGRIKELIIIYGRNIYPDDVEASVQACHPALRPGCGAAFSVPGEGTERLVVMQELRRGRADAPNEVKAAIRRTIARDHGVDAHRILLLPPGALPKTSSGKIRRRVCRASFLRGATPVASQAAHT